MTKTGEVYYSDHADCLILIDEQQNRLFMALNDLDIGPFSVGIPIPVPNLVKHWQLEYIGRL